MAAGAARPMSLEADADTRRRTQQPVFQVDSHTYQASAAPQPVHQVNARTYQANMTPQPVFQIDSRTYHVIGGGGGTVV
jgi:hypothetical protein